MARQRNVAASPSQIFASVAPGKNQLPSRRSLLSPRACFFNRIPSYSSLQFECDSSSQWSFSRFLPGIRLLEEYVGGDSSTRRDRLVLLYFVWESVDLISWNFKFEEFLKDFESNDRNICIESRRKFWNNGNWNMMRAA